MFLVERRKCPVENLFSDIFALVTHDIDESVYLADRVIALGKSPGTVLEMIDIDLSRPRDQLATKEHPDFLAHRHRVYQLLHRSDG